MDTSRTFSIHFWLNLAKEKEGLAPIYARITVDGKRAEISLKRVTQVTFWDTNAKKTTSRSTEGKQLNNYLDQVHAKLLACHKELSSDFELVTAQSIKSRFTGVDSKHKTLLQLVTYHNENTNGTLMPGTLKNYYTTENYLKLFLRRYHRTGDIYLRHIRYGFIIDFEQFLRKGPSLQGSNPLNNNGVMKHLSRLKKLMNFALDLEWVDKNPFARYKLKMHKHESEFLEKHELETLKNAFVPEEGHRIARDVFVFSCYTGLSYIDVKKLKKGNVVRGVDGGFWLFLERTKTRYPLRIPLLEEAMEILDKFRDVPIVENNGLLPVLTNQKMNSYIKEVAKRIGIDKKLTFHSARHTFATTVTLSNGVPIATVSKLLGHTKITTTQIYARVLEEKISADMDGLRTVLKNDGGRIGNKVSGR
ncbi:site-specific integrase [Flagellimonas amoyensis]|uniref:site-specific integrase n=1 Tax=Flagellimonas amoyensis TaxID=2169401 RepID=UPI000D3A26F0|nr:site-specific integrase [Allomuricauda amoyensis]